MTVVDEPSCRLVTCIGSPLDPSLPLCFVLWTDRGHEMHGTSVSFLSYTVCLTFNAGLVSYDGDDSQSDSETPNELKFTAKVDNVRVIISRLAVAVSLWLAVPPLGVRTPY